MRHALITEAQDSAAGMPLPGSTTRAGQQDTMAAPVQVPKWLVQPDAAREALQAKVPDALLLPELWGKLVKVLERNELELWQAHVWRSLTTGLQYAVSREGQVQAEAEATGSHAGAAASHDAPTWKLLMADWVSVNMQHPDLRTQQLAQPAAKVYADAGESAGVG